MDSLIDTSLFFLFCRSEARSAEARQVGFFDNRQECSNSLSCYFCFCLSETARRSQRRGAPKCEPPHPGNMLTGAVSHKTHCVGGSPA